MNKHRVIFDFIVLFVLACIPFLWLPKGYILTGHDSGYPINVIEAYKNRFYTWNTQDNLGRDNTTSIGTIPLLSIQAAATRVGFDLRTSEIITFIFWFLCMELAMYFAAYMLIDVFPYESFPLMAAVVYSINYYLLALWRYGAATTFSAFAALPLVCAFYLAMLRKKMPPVQAGLAIGFTSILFNGGGGLSLPLFGGLLVSLIWFSIFFIITTSVTNRFDLLKTLAVCLLVSFVCVLGINAYWFLPFLSYVITHFHQNLADAGGVKAVISWTDSVSKFTSAINLFRLQGFPDWYDNIYHPYANSILQKPLFIFISFLYAPLAYSSVLFAKEGERRRLVLGFFILSLLGVLFAAGVHQPTGWIFEKLMYIIPGFVVFRSAQYKFVPALYFSFAILIAYVLSYLTVLVSTRIQKNTKKNYFIPILCSSLIVGVVLLYHYPYLRRGFFYYNKTLSTLLAVPNYINGYDDWLKLHGEDEIRTLVLPRYNSSWKAGIFDWNYFSLYSPFNLIRPKPFVLYSYYLNESQFVMFNRLSDEVMHKGPLQEQLQQIFQIHRILWAKDTKNTTEDMPSENPQVYATALSDESLYTPLWQQDKWSVYEIKSKNTTNKIFGLDTLTQFIGPNTDVMAAILAQSNNFYLSKILGTKYDNAIHPDIAIENSIFASPCESCIFDSMIAEVLPTYTNILPGSMFYPLKRWQEKRSFHLVGDQKQLVTQHLGLSLKRLAESDSMITQNKPEADTNAILAELIAHWSYVRSYVKEGSALRSDLGLVRIIHSYTISEKSIARKQLDRSSSVSIKRALGDLIAIISDVEGVLVSVESSFADTAMYTIPDKFSVGELYMDAAMLPKTDSGAPLIPDQIRIDGVFHAITPTQVDEKIILGNFTISQDKHVVLHFPQLRQEIGPFSKTEIQSENGTNACLTSEVRDFGSLQKYVLDIDNASLLPSTTVFYLVRNNPSYTLSNRSDTPPKLSDAFTFSRTSSLMQHSYFAAHDGDVGARFYVCTSTKENPISALDLVSIKQIYAPSLYFSLGDKSSADISPIEYRRIDQTKYEVTLPENIHPKILVFNENYDAQWKLYPVDSMTTGIQRFTQTWFKRSLPATSHFSLYGFANSWYIGDIKNRTFIIEYYPQKLFYEGIIVSIIGLVGSLGAYIWMRKK